MEIKNGKAVPVNKSKDKEQKEDNKIVTQRLVDWKTFRQSLLRTDIYMGIEDNEPVQGPLSDYVMEDYHEHYPSYNMYAVHKRLITLLLCCDRTNINIPKDVWKIIADYSYAINVLPEYQNEYSKPQYCELCHRIWYGECNAPTVSVVDSEQTDKYMMSGCYDAYDCMWLYFIDPREFDYSLKYINPPKGMWYDKVYHLGRGREYVRIDNEVKFLTKGEVEKLYPWENMCKSDEICSMCIDAMIRQEIIVYTCR